MPFDDEPTADPGAPIEAGPLVLEIVTAAGASEVPLPTTGELLVGRARASQIQIEHPSVSRKHALIRVAAGGVTIEDLGSQNGTFVAGERLAAGVPAPFSIGALVLVGCVQIRLSSGSFLRLPRRVWPHAYIEGRVEDECARVRRNGGSFALLRLSAPGAAPGLCEKALGATLREQDVLGHYAAGDYEALLVDTTPEEAEVAAKRVISRLQDAGIEARVVLSCFPRDGGSAEEILSHANATLRGAAADRLEYSGRIANSPAMKHIFALIEKVAPSNVSVLILGETGVGKEICAQSIHRHSQRAARTFLKLHCAALPESLIESELFGHEKGAFTGAHSARAGLIESADGGTVFLDEIGELPLSMQVKLLRVLDTREVLRIGGRQPKRVDVRFLAATNRRLEAEVQAGRFREDLYYRLAGVVLSIPPLRERANEIEPLARGFVEEACAQLARTPPPITTAALAELQRYPWPGNIRELRNAMERAVILSAGAPIDPSHLPSEKFGTLRASRLAVMPSLGSAADFSNVEVTTKMQPPPALYEEVEALEQERVRAALAEAHGNQSEAARRLGMSRGALLARLRAWGMIRNKS